MLNNCNFVGRLVRDPEMRYSKGGDEVTNFTLAVERNYKTQNDETPVDYIDFVAWKKTGIIIAENLSKGRLIAVEGSLQQSKWQTDEGKNRSSYKVNVNRFHFLDYPDKDEKDVEENSNSDIEVPF